jgi:hypothetical protein
MSAATSDMAYLGRKRRFESDSSRREAFVDGDDSPTEREIT